MTYLIFPGEYSKLEIDPEILARKLLEKWSTTEFMPPVDDETILLEWTIKDGHIDHVGTLQNDRKMITIDDYPAGVSEFVVWYRGIVPDDDDLFLCHDSDGDLNLKITINSKIDEIIEELTS